MPSPRIVADTHCDHNLLLEHYQFIKKRFNNIEGFTLETVELPDYLPPLMSALYGPLAGDGPVAEADVTYEVRGTREWPSRLVARHERPTRFLTVIAGPGDDGLDGVVLYTAYGGKCAPREPGDTSLNDEQRLESQAFWSEHALAADVGT